MSMMYYTNTISENIEETPEGFLICKNVSIARTGLMEYQNEGQIEGVTSDIVQIGHIETELSKTETLASFEGKSITIDHPEEMLSPENIKDYTVGHIQNVRYCTTSQTLVADLVIILNEAISLVKGGLREVSCGYWADVVPNDDGSGYLSNVVGNHLALVNAGRCGGKCSIQDSIKTNEREKMTKETLLEKISNLFKDSEDVKKEPETVADEFDAKSAIDALNKRIDELEATKQTDETEAVEPSKEDQILELLNKLLGMEAKEEGSEVTEDDEDEMGDAKMDSIEIKVGDIPLMDGLVKSPTPAELNAMYANKFGGKK